MFVLLDDFWIQLNDLKNNLENFFINIPIPHGFVVIPFPFISQNDCDGYASFFDVPKLWVDCMH